MANSKKAVVLASTDLPAHLQQSGGLGNENVSSDHLQVPRIKQLQGISHEIDKYHANYIEGAEVGQWLLTSTNELFGEEIYAINVKFDENYVIWAEREAGGGNKGSFPTEAAAEEALAQLPDSKNCYIQHTHDHALLLMNPETGELDTTPCMFSMNRSKMSTSRNWNTQIMQRPGDRFSSVWKVSSVRKEGKKGVFMVAEVEWVGYAQEADYNAAKEVYLNMTPEAKAAAA